MEFLSSIRSALSEMSSRASKEDTPRTQLEKLVGQDKVWHDWTPKKPQCPETLLDDHPVRHTKNIPFLKISQDQLSLKRGQEILQALKQQNFFVLSLSEETQNVLRDLRDHTERFYDLPKDQKDAVPETHRGAHGFNGYTRVHIDNSGSSRLPETREIFSMHLDEADNIVWPNDTFKQSCLAAYKEINALLVTVLTALEHSSLRCPTELTRLLNEDESAGTFWEDHGDLWQIDPLTNFAMIKYSDPQNTYQTTQKCMVHEDAGLLTAVPKSNYAGLQIFDHSLQEFVSIENCLSENDVVIYAGKTLEVATKGRLHAAAHRVVREPGIVRYSFPFELKAHPSATLSAPSTLLQERDETRWNFIECEVVHNAICDFCGKHIAGVRHKCTVCADFDACDACVNSRAHEHAYEEIRVWPFQDIHQNEKRSFPMYKFLAEYATKRRVYRMWRLNYFLPSAY